MKLYIKYDVNIVLRKLLEEQLDQLEMSYSLTGLNEIEIKKPLSDKEYSGLHEVLKKYSIEIVDDRINKLVQKTKDTIIELVYLDEKLPPSKISAYISKKLNYSYGYISELFSEVTFSSIEHFFIIQKIERAKLLIAANELSLSEISFMLNYSSLAHLSAQFRKTTGITPTAFQRIIKKRRELSE